MRGSGLPRRLWQLLLRLKYSIDAHPVPALEEREKREFLLSLLQRHRLSVFIETGSYLGHTAEFMAPYVARCVTIELDSALHEEAKRRLAQLDNVQALHGDSAERLAAVLQTVDTPALFWLDAHYSGGRTARGNRNSPIEAELTTIFDHPVKRPVIAIDDARAFLGLDGYPSIAKLRNLISSKSDYSIRMRNDVIWLYREVRYSKPDQFTAEQTRL
jgi:hypothetical protein